MMDKVQKELATYEYNCRVRNFIINSPIPNTEGLSLEEIEAIQYSMTEEFFAFLNNLHEEIFYG